MTKKTKHLTIRITEEQFKKLADTLVTEEKTKSALMRDLLRDYTDGKRSVIDNRNQKNNVNQKSIT